MPAGVLLIGLDAAEPTLIERWATEGRMPTFANLRAEGLTAQLSNCLETLPGGIWPEIVSGRSSGKLGLFYHPWQIHTGEAEPRPVRPSDVDSSEYFWSVASRAGKRVAVVDLPQTAPCPDLSGIQVFEWGLHDRWIQPATDPPNLLREINSRYGDHPVQHCDLHHNCTEDGYKRLLDDLLDGVRVKTDLLLDLLGRQNWDLFACAFGESHCAGHHFWHFHESSDPSYDPDAPPELRNALSSVYGEIDRGIGRVLEAVSEDTQVIVVASHGMGPKTGGPQLLPEFLERMGLCTPKPKEDPRVRLRSLLPKRLRKGLKAVAGNRLFRAVEPVFGVRSREMDRPGTRATNVRNNRCGGIRLNLIGREPNGTVEPGPEAEALVSELRSELLSLQDPDTGKPIVSQVQTVTECFGPDHHPDLPDVIVLFRSEDLIQGCHSERLGEWRAPLRQLDGPYWRQSSRRTGDHTANSRLWAIGPGVTPGSAPAGSVLDIAPTVLSRLGVGLPDWLDGKPITMS